MPTPDPKALEGASFNWNQQSSAPPRRVELYDESLRDGVQSPSVIDPTIEEKLRIVQLMEDLGIDSADVGLPGAGPRAHEHVKRICEYKRDNKLKLIMCTAARTVITDIAPVAKLQQEVGVPITVYTFIGSSPIRQFAEDWTVEHLVKTSVTAIEFAVKEGLECAFVTEDTTRSAPGTLARMFRAAIDSGASRLCLCDTVGHATPDGVRKLIAWTQHLIAGSGASVRIDWHGHNDRGLALVNALEAARAGADRVHGTALGIGERVGNTAMDLLLMNLKLQGVIDQDLSALGAYVRLVSEATKVPIPAGWPVAPAPQVPAAAAS